MIYKSTTYPGQWYVARPGMEERSAPHFQTRAEARRWLRANRVLAAALVSPQQTEEPFCRRPREVTR